jgi:hypothetical protein
MTDILLFLIYGEKKSYHLELTYSILSAARFLKNDPANIRIVLMSDKKNSRSDLPVEQFVVTDSVLHEWQLQGSYKHAAKLFALKHALSIFEGPTILLDSDTIVKQHPKELFKLIKPGTGILHTKEGQLCDSAAWPNWEDLIKTSNGEVGPSTVCLNSIMFNSGVIGIHPDNYKLLDDAISTMRGIRKYSSMFTAEQLAVSLVFKKELNVLCCETAIDHYWNGRRDYYHYQINKMFPNLLKGEATLYSHEHFQELTNHLPARYYDRFITRLRMFRRRVSPEYYYAYVAYVSALAQQRENPELANVWAANALNMLMWGVDESEEVAGTDFNQFKGNSLKSQEWMHSSLRARWAAYWTEKEESSTTSDQ